MTQPQTAASRLATEVSKSSTLSATDLTISQQIIGVSETQEMSKSPELTRDKTPLPFEDIPGPAILKIFEKYWKYVPIFGTQLISSLLINKLTLGTIYWKFERNETRNSNIQSFFELNLSSYVTRYYPSYTSRAN